LVFYVSLAAFSFGIFAVFYQSIQNDSEVGSQPKYLDIIGKVPGLAFRPRAENANDYIGILTFKTSNAEDVQRKVDEIDELLRGNLR
jgi:Sodium / potassium ATPase beta chain